MLLRPLVHRCRVWPALGLVLWLAATSGCTAPLLTALYLIRGTDEEAECKELKGKRVAVVCRPLVTLQFRNANVAKDVAREVGMILKENVSKIQLVDQIKVDEYMDEKATGEDDYLDIGRALKADLVLGIDLEQFDVLLGQTVYQGRATTSIKLYDCKTAKLVFRKEPPEIKYPPNHAIPTVNKAEGEFRREFVQVLAKRIARHFHDHDPNEDVGLDSRAEE
jgi:hypothetical protein